MGNHWAWPCGERDKRKPYIDSGRPQTADLDRGVLARDRKTDSVTILVLRCTVIDNLLYSKDLRDRIPVSIACHPIDPERGIVVLQPTARAKIQFRGPCKFKYRDCNLAGSRPQDWIYSLENVINSSYDSEHMEFIGGIKQASGSFYLSFLKIEHGETKGSRFDVECVPSYSVNRSSLQDHLNANGEENKHFRAALEHDQYLFIISEELPEDISLNYIIVDFPSKEIMEPEFETLLGSMISEHISEGYEFRGVVSVCKELYIVFTR